ncbi:MAG: hypothetical protein AAFN63_11035 [Pseudomonadota bacterium]
MIRAILTAAALFTGATMAYAQETTATVVEIATFDFAEGVNAEAFAPVDARVEAEHVSQQPGFVSRETGATDTGWVAIVHWETAAAAQASMDSFANAPAAADFMGMMNVETMRMTRYDIK